VIAESEMIEIKHLVAFINSVLSQYKRKIV